MICQHCVTWSRYFATTGERPWRVSRSIRQQRTVGCNSCKQALRGRLTAAKVQILGGVGCALPQRARRLCSTCSSARGSPSKGSLAINDSIVILGLAWEHWKRAVAGNLNGPVGVVSLATSLHIGSQMSRCLSSSSLLPCVALDQPPQKIAESLVHGRVRRIVRLEAKRQQTGNMCRR